MKYVYVLTSSDKDFYYEQFFISAVSLRIHNPHAYIIALIDSKTKDGLTEKRSEYEQFVSEIITITAPEELSQREVSRWIKTSINKYVTGNFLYLDCDTVITENLSYEFPLECSIGAIIDKHLPLSKHPLTPYLINRDKRIGFTSSSEMEKYYNGGVIYCSDTPAGNEFFTRWHSLWNFSIKKGSHHDMPALNQANLEMENIITELNGEWNCQITDNGLPFLFNAKIIHCFATSIELFNCPFLPASIPVLNTVKETGKISFELMELLKNPKAAFENKSRIISGETELDVINSKLFSLLMFFRKKMPGLFKILNSSILKIRARTQK
jgi:hypothetical protein